MSEWFCSAGTSLRENWHTLLLRNRWNLVSFLHWCHKDGHSQKERHKLQWQWVTSVWGNRISYIQLTPNNQGHRERYLKTIMNNHKEIHFVRIVDDSLSAGTEGRKWEFKLRAHRNEIFNSTILWYMLYYRKFVSCVGQCSQNRLTIKWNVFSISR